MENINLDKQFKKPVAMLAMVLLGVLILFVASLTRNSIAEFSYIGRSDQQIYTINISGEGKVNANPDIASLTLGVQTEKPDVASAQKENSDKMNKIISQIKDIGIEDKDIRTVNYNIYPMYDYTTSRGQILRGYQVNQSVTVKIRDLSKVSEVLDFAGQSGANNVSGLSFTIDEPEALRQQARELALKNAKEKAEALAKVAGVKLGKLVSFNESYGDYPTPFYRDVAAEAIGLGGGGTAPSIEPGSQDIVINVNVTYEVL